MDQTDWKYFPYGRQNVTEQDIEAVNEVLRSDFLTQGPKVQDFEKNISNFLDVEHSLAVSNATSALHLACLALDLKDGDSVWTSPTTFVASANCARYCGADIDFVDIDLATGLMDVNKLSEKLSIAKENKKLPKIVIPVHLTGSSCDMEPIYELSKQYGFAIIEDASHALGGQYKNSFVGSCQYSDFTVFSFHPVKIITTGEGGILTTKNKSLAKKADRLRNHGIVKDKELFENSYNGPWSYEQQMLGYNFRMNDIQASLGISQLRRLEKIVNERNKQLKLYKDLLKSLPIKFLDIPKNVRSSVHLGVIKLEGFSKNAHRKIFCDLRKKGIGVQIHYCPVHLNPYFRRLGFSEGDFPNSELYSQKAMSIPIYPGLGVDDQLHIIEIIKDVIID